MSGFVEVLPPELTGPEHPEWFAARAKGVTASEIAAVLGLSPNAWESPFSLYWLKKAGIGAEPDNAGMSWGRRLERYLADEFAAQHYELEVQPAGLYANAERRWQMASPDGLLTDTKDSAAAYHYEWSSEPLAVLECKTDYSWDEWGEEGSDEIPVYYRAQVLWQMDTLGVSVAYLPVGVGRSYREYVVSYDETDAKIMRAAAEEFLDRLAHGGPPPIDGSQATIRALKALHPDLDDTEAEVPARLAAQWLAAARAEKRAKQRKKAAEAKLRDRMGRARVAVHGGEKVATRVISTVKEHVRAESTRDYLNPPRETT